MQMPSYVADFAIKMKRQMVMLATVYTITELCFIFGISRKTYYKYKKDVDLFDSKGFFYNSSAPEHVHNKTPEWIELLVVDFSVEKYWWLSSYRISDLLEAEKRIKLSPSTIQNIWRRYHVPEVRSKRYYAQRPKKKDKKQEGRFEAIRPHVIWQIDIAYAYKKEGKWIYLIAIIDDHSRYIVNAILSSDQKAKSVLETFKEAVQQFGCPQVIVTDNGKQFKSKAFRRLCEALNTEIDYAPPYYAQYKGKIERWIETFRSDFLSQFMSFEDKNLVEMQENLCDFVRIYNTTFKHKEIGNIPPCVRMKDAKGKDLPENINWSQFISESSHSRKIKKDGCILFFKKRYYVSDALCGCPVEVYVSRGILTVVHNAKTIASFQLHSAA